MIQSTLKEQEVEEKTENDDVVFLKTAKQNRKKESILEKKEADTAQAEIRFS